MAVLKVAAITALLDMRAAPRSRHNPQFNEETLREACARAGIVYHWTGRMLGGLRVSRTDSPHVVLDLGFRGFADHMASDGFKKGAGQLRAMGTLGPTACMCAERLPENFHRSLIADSLFLQGARVIHLLNAKPRAQLPEWYCQQVQAAAFVLFPICVGQNPVGLFYADLHRGALEISREAANLLVTLRNQSVLAFRQASAH